MISVRNYVKTFGKIEVLRVENIIFNSGVYWIIGENGSGKSTFLKSVAGIIDFEGEIILDQTLNSKSAIVAYRKLVNFSEAEPVFPEFLTGKDLIQLFMEAKSATQSQADYYIKSFEMENYIGELVGTYSSGMLKKLSIVLAFLGHPKIILLDEPLITLDTHSLTILRQWIEERHNNDHVTFLISSHQAFSLNKTIEVSTVLVQNNTIRHQSV